MRYHEIMTERPLTAKKLSKNDLINIEIFLDRLYSHIGIDLDLHRRHFIERLNDTIHTNNPIYLREVKQLFEKIYKKYKHKLHAIVKNKSEKIEMVLQDLNKDINIPVVLLTSPHFEVEEADIIAKTVKKAPNFTTSNVKLTV